MKSPWASWAMAWGLAHHPQRSWLMRNEWMVGARRGFLVKIGWTGEYGSILYILVRFPKQPDAKALRERLILDPRVGQMAGGRGARRSPLVVDERSLLWRHTSSWRTPRAEEVRAWAEQLLDGLAAFVPPFDGRCEQCQATGVTEYVLEEGAPIYLCRGCQERILADASLTERKYAQLEANYGLGAIYAVAAAAAGGVGWALLAIGTHRVYAIMAIGIAWLTAWAYIKGAGKVDRPGQLIAAILTLGGIAFGEVIFFAYHAHRARPEIPFRLDVGWVVFMRVLTERPGELAAEAVFGVLGIWYIFRLMRQPKFRPTFEQPGNTSSRRMSS